MGSLEEAARPEEVSAGAMGDVTRDVTPRKTGRKHDMLPPFTAAHQFTTAHPLVIVKSDRCHVTDSDGTVYLDALAGLWSTALGGSEERLVQAAEKQMRELPFYHSFWNRTTLPAMELAKVLTDLFTASKMGQVFFTNDGSEANDTQVKLVWYYNNALGRPEKKKIISRNRAYHGSTLVAASLTGLTPMHSGFDIPVPFVIHTDCPHYYRYAKEGESEEDFSSRLAENLENLILKEDPKTIAAFIAEPLMGAGGVLPPPKGYFEKIQKVLKKYEILLIADEVICGFGRTGYMFGCDKWGIKPDLVSLAKALSSAYMPIGAVMISEEIAAEVAAHSDKMGSFAHGFTYSGHPVACAVALEAIKIYTESDIASRVLQLEPMFQGGMHFICKDSPIVGEVRGVGLILAVEFVSEKDKKSSFPASWQVGSYFGKQAAKNGMLVRTIGDIIAMSPPLIITPSEIQELISKFSITLKETEKYVALKREEST